MTEKKHHNPFRGVRDILSEMNRMADRMSSYDIGPQGVQPRTHTDAWSPTTDILARGADLVIRSELPGVSPDHLEVNLSNGVLTISGYRERGPERSEDFYVHERYYGQFRREISLPQGVRDEDIQASLTEGVLEIVVHNCANAPGPRPIQIRHKSSPGSA